MKDLILLEDVLFVFGTWILMRKMSTCCDLVFGAQVDLFDENQKVVGMALLHKYLSSRHPEIVPINIDMLSMELESDMKEVRFIKLIS